MMAARTILGAEPRAEVRGEWAREAKEWEKGIGVITNVWLAAYRDGDLTFERLCEYTEKTLRRFDHEVTRQRWLGNVLERALRGPKPKKRPRGNPGMPRIFRTRAARLVRAVARAEGLSRNIQTAWKKGQPTAFKRAAEIISELTGTEISEHQVRKWYDGG